MGRENRTQERSTPADEAGAEAWTEAERPPSVDDLPPVEPETPEERKATHREIARAERYREVLALRGRTKRDRERLADLLRDDDLPAWVRHAVADIIDSRKRWQPRWIAYRAMEEALWAEDPEQVLRAGGYPRQIVVEVLGELRALRSAHAFERLYGEGLSYEEAIERLAEEPDLDVRTVRRLVQKGRHSDLFDPTP